MSNDNVTTDEIMEFLKEHMVTKEDLHDFFTKDDTVELRSDILTSVDRFAKLHETLDIELVSLQSKYGRLEERLKRVEEKVGITV